MSLMWAASRASARQISRELDFEWTTMMDRRDKLGALNCTHLLPGSLIAPSGAIHTRYSAETAAKYPGCRKVSGSKDCSN